MPDTTTILLLLLLLLVLPDYHHHYYDSDTLLAQAEHGQLSFLTRSPKFLMIFFRFLRKLAQESSLGFATREGPLHSFIAFGADWNFPRERHPEGVHVGEFLSDVLGGGSSM
jgi:hypothetical protein